MEFLNKKQKIILIIIGTLIVFFIGYYIVQKTIVYKDYEELEIIEENNVDIRHFYSK